MDSASVSSISTGVDMIIHAYAEGSQLFKMWRHNREGKKALRQAELEASLYDGEKSIQAKLDSLSRKHGSKFDNDDRQFLESIVKIRKDFRKDLIDVFIRSTASKGGKEILIDPIALRLVSEVAKKDTLQTMDEHSQRLQAEAIPRPLEIRKRDPGDVLPHMPLLGSQTSSQIPFATPPAPLPPRDSQRTPLPILKPPLADDSEEPSIPQAMVRRRPLMSAISRMFSLKPRPYYLLTPHPPSLSVVPSYKRTEDGSDILEEGRSFVAGLWDAAKNSRDSPQAERPQSTPLLQAPWDILVQDEFCSSTSPHARDSMPPSPEESTPMLVSGPETHDKRRPGQPGQRIRSEPVMTFSTPTPRFRRNVSGPPGLSRD